MRNSLLSRTKDILKQITPPVLWELVRSQIMRPTASHEMSLHGPILSNDWFASNIDNWNELLSQLQPKRILEIGSFEGASTCYLIETLAALYEIEIHCIDTWEGGIEHKSGGIAQSDMSVVEERFRRNTQLAIKSAPKTVSLFIHKALSDTAIPKLINENKNSYFDFIYVDGSHQAPDVLFDAVTGFKLLKIGGVMAFDDYLWAEALPYGTDPVRCPKPAIDAFINLNIRKLKVLNAPLGQLFIQKTSD